jgi:hypothetical protein
MISSGSDCGPESRDSNPTRRLPRAGRPLPTKQAATGSSLILRASWLLRRQALRTSSSSAVPLPCHSQRSRPVLSGHPRTTPERHGPALFPAFAGDGTAQSGFASRGSWVRVPSSPPPDQTSCSAGVPTAPHSANWSTLPLASRSTLILNRAFRRPPGGREQETPYHQGLTFRAGSGRSKRPRRTSSRKALQTVGWNARIGPLRSLESRTVTRPSMSATSTQPFCVESVLFRHSAERPTIMHPRWLLPQTSFQGSGSVADDCGPLSGLGVHRGRRHLDS